LKFSVILRTFNRPDFLREALLSVFLQTHQDWEVIIFDDGGTVENFSIFSKFKQFNSEKRIIYLTSKTPRELFKSSWNQSFQLADGDLVIRLDDDDILEKTCFSYLEKIYTEHPKLDFSYGSMFSFSENKLIGSGISFTPVEHPPTRSIWAGYIEGYPYNSPWTFYDDFYETPRHFTSIIHASKSNYMCVCHPMVFRKSTVSKFSERIHVTSNYVDDLEFLGSLDNLGLCHTALKKKLIYFRHHNLDRVTNDPSLFNDIFRVRDEVDKNWRTEDFKSNLHETILSDYERENEVTEQDQLEFEEFSTQIKENLILFD
jgi:glycosyltransferase involved in cell wall biosynthesis